MTFTATVPVQPTDISVPITLPKFNPANGTLTEVDLSLSSSANEVGTLTNAGDATGDFSFQQDINLNLTDTTTSTTLIPTMLTEVQTYTNVAPQATVAFGPFSPTNSNSFAFTSGATFDEFAKGPGNVNLLVQSLTTQTVTGGGGNIKTKIVTNAGAVATVTYKFSVVPVTLAGNVYEDVNGTGALAPGDKPIPGVLLTLVDSTGTSVATTTTGPGGTYAFTTTSTGGQILPGTYAIDETQPAGFLQGTNTVGTVNGVTVGALTGVDQIGSIVLSQGQNSVNNNFGEVLPVTLSGTVYNDRNRSGVLDAGDSPIANVTVNLFDANGMVATTTTNVFGFYQFASTTAGAPLRPGTYTIVELAPAGFQEGATNVGTVNGVPNGVVQAVDIIGSIGLKSGQNSVSNNFGEITPTALSPLVINNVQRFGVHNQPTLIVLSFNTPLNPTTAQDIFNYKIFGPTDSKTPAFIPVESANYDAATQTVTLQLGQRLQIHHPYTLTVTGLLNADGTPLSSTSGVPGAPYVTTLNRSLLSGFIDQFGNFVPIDHGKLYPAASAAGFKAKHFVAPDNIGSFASQNLGTFLTATSGPNSDFQVISVGQNSAKFTRQRDAVRGSSPFKS